MEFVDEFISYGFIFALLLEAKRTKLKLRKAGFVLLLENVRAHVFFGGFFLGGGASMVICRVIKTKVEPK